MNLFLVYVLVGMLIGIAVAHMYDKDMQKQMGDDYDPEIEGIDTIVIGIVAGFLWPLFLLACVYYFGIRRLMPSKQNTTSHSSTREEN